MVSRCSNKKTNNYLYNAGKFVITIIITMMVVIMQISPVLYAAAEETNTSESSETSEETLGKIDAAKCVSIGGDAENGYYLEFTDEINEKLQQIYDNNKTSLKNLGVDNIDTLKSMIKAELATTMPKLGGVVTSTAAISTGTEAPAHPGGGSGSSGGGTVVLDGEYIWPVSGQNDAATRAANITDLFGPRESPGGVGSPDHKGLDIGCSIRTLIVATADGTVTQSEYTEGYGNVVTISHSNGMTSLYAHNDELIASVGQKVKASEAIAYAGTTGPSTGVHCHFQINDSSGVAVDPLELFTAEQVAGDTSSDCSGGSSHVTGYRTSTGTTKTGTKTTGTVGSSSSSTGYMSGTSDNQDATITISDNKNVGTDDNKFEGGVTLRRLTPNKKIGAYDGSLERDEAEYEFGDIEGKGSYEPIPDNIKNLMKKATLSSGISTNMDDLSYLTIPYIDFNANIKNGHLIVNKDIAEEVVEIFYELYCIKYRIDRMDLVDSFLAANENKVEEAVVEQDKKIEEKKEEEAKKEGNTKQTEEKPEIGVDKEKVAEKRTVDSATDLAKASADNNNTASLFNSGKHAQGYAIDINPMINPATTNGTTTQYNASRYVDRSEEARNDWSNEAKLAYIDKDSEICKIFEKHGWTWGGTNGDYGHFEKTSTISDEVTEAKSIDSRYYDLSYVDEQTFNSYIKTGDKRALYVFTLNTNNEVVIASWSYSSIDGFKITTGKTVNIKSALQKYGMPVEYLIAMLYQTEDINFVNGLAALGQKSQYVVTIEDKVTTTETTEVTDTTIEGEEYVKVANSQEEKPMTSIGDLKEEEYSGKNKEKRAYKDHYSDSHTYYNESTAQLPEVTYVNNWYVKYSKKIQSYTGGNLSSDANVSKIIDKFTNVNGTKTDKTTKNFQVLVDEQLFNGEFKEGFSGYVHYYSYKKTEKNSITYEYKLEKEDISGNASKFIELYNNSSSSVKNNLYIPWLEDNLQYSEKTVDLVNVTKYLVYQANHQTYGADRIIYSSLELSEFKPDAFTSASGSAGGSGTLNLTGSDVKEKIWNALKSAGYSDKSVAAVMGNIEAESSFIVDNENKESGAYGICQWLGDRQTRLKEYAANTGRQFSDLEVQVEYLIGEISETGGCQGSARAQFANGHEDDREIWTSDSSSLDDATIAFRKGFERCGEDEARDDVRTSAANDYYNMYAGKK